MLFGTFLTDFLETATQEQSSYSYAHVNASDYLKYYQNYNKRFFGKQYRLSYGDPWPFAKSEKITSR